MRKPKTKPKNLVFSRKLKFATFTLFQKPGKEKVHFCGAGPVLCHLRAQLLTFGDRVKTAQAEFEICSLGWPHIYDPGATGMG